VKKVQEKSRIVRPKSDGIRAGLTIVPVVQWEGASPPAPRSTAQFFPTLVWRCRLKRNDDD